MTTAGPPSLSAAFLCRRFRLAVMSPLVLAGLATVSCSDDNTYSVTKCLQVEPGDCQSRDNARALLSTCLEPIVSVDSNGEKIGEGECCYQLTVEEGEECPVITIDGRPLRSKAQVIVAESSQASHWQLFPRKSTQMAQQVGEGSHLSALESQELAAYWTRVGQYEHASIASFQKHALELMRWGAPALLVRQATEAALDEIEHASLCFEQASRHTTQAVGPGAMPLGSSVDIADSLEELALSVFEDGCINETLATVNAEYRRQVATDPAVLATLETIAQDEANHAELAWRTLSWICAQWGTLSIAPLRRMLALHVETLERKLRIAGEASTPSQAERSHGQISEGERLAQLRFGLLTIVGPCLEILCSSIGTLSIDAFEAQGATVPNCPARVTESA